METIHEEGSIDNDLGRSMADTGSETNATPAKGGTKAEGEVVIETIAARKKKLKEKAKKEKEEKKREKIEANPRELTKLTITSVSLTDVVQAHRFAKNSLWIKCSVAGNVWELDSQGVLNGENADWNDLTWTFIRARNVSDRTELVVSVGSKEVIIGKYILTPEEFDSIPDSPYFEISGRIMSSLGKVGHITMTCKRVEAERPKRAAPSTLEDIVLPTVLFLPQEEMVYIKLLRITLTELKSVHLMDRNSPYCKVNCGPNWEKSTSVLVRAGGSAMWDRLTWKIIMNAESQLIFTVGSLSLTIGQTVVTLAEIVGASKSRNASLIDLDRYVSDGSSIVGQLNVRLQIDVGHPPSDSLGDVPYDDVTTYNKDINPAKQQFEMGYKDSDSLVLRNGKAPMQSQFCLPYIVHVTTVGTYDIKSSSVLSGSSLRVNAAVGDRAYATTMVSKSDRSAEWNGLKWDFVINKGSKLRLTVWTVQKMVGQITLDEFDLLDRPMDDKGIVDMMLKIYKRGSHYRGKVRLVCEFRPYIAREEFRLLRALKPNDDIKLDDEDRGHEDTAAPLKLATGLEFPIIATVESIYLYDLTAVHFLFPNSPRLKLRCDQNIAFTKELRFVGMEGKWEALNWPVPMNEGSDMLVTVTSGEILIGNWEYIPAHILRLPRTANNKVEVVGQLMKNEYFAGRVKMLIQLQPMNSEQFRKYYPAGPIGEFIIQGSASVPSKADRPKDSISLSTVAKPINPFDAASSAPIFENVSNLVFDPNARSFFGFSVTLDIIEVFAAELASAHLFKPNSPFVVAMCGKWEERTKVITKGGATGNWTSLTWSCGITETSSVHLIVGSGEKIIGTTRLTADELMAAKADKAGIRRVLASLEDGERYGRCTGKLKIAFLIEINRDSSVELEGQKPTPLQVVVPKANLTLAQQRSALFSIVAQAKAQQAPGSTINADELEDVYFPIVVVVHKISVSSLDSVHRFDKNSPYVSITVDDWVGSTVMKKDAGSATQWENLGWQVPIKNSSCIVQVNVRSHRRLIGSIDISTHDIIRIRKDHLDVTEVSRSISIGGAASGNVTMILKIHDSRSSYYRNYIGADLISQKAGDEEDEDAKPVSILSSKRREEVKSPLKAVTLDLPPVSAKDAYMAVEKTKTADHNLLTINESTNARRKPGPRAGERGQSRFGKVAGGAETPQLTATADAVGGFKINVVDMVQRLESSAAAAAIEAARAAKEAERLANKELVAISTLPVLMQLKSISLIELRKCHKLANNSPKVSVVCGPWAAVTQEMKNGGAAAIFNDLDQSEWEFIIDEDESSSLGIVVTSQNEILGTVAVTAQELIRIERTTSGVMKVIKDLAGPPKFPVAGKVKLVFSFEKIKVKKPKKIVLEEVDAKKESALQTAIEREQLALAKAKEDMFYVDEDEMGEDEGDDFDEEGAEDDEGEGEGGGDVVDDRDDEVLKLVQLRQQNMKMDRSQVSDSYQQSGMMEPSVLTMDPGLA